MAPFGEPGEEPLAVGMRLGPRETDRVEPEPYRLRANPIGEWRGGFRPRGPCGSIAAWRTNWKPNPYFRFQTWSSFPRRCSRSTYLSPGID